MNVALQKQVMKNAFGVAVHWDEASAGGLSVNIGFAVDACTWNAAGLPTHGLESKNHQFCLNLSGSKRLTKTTLP